MSEVDQHLRCTSCHVPYDSSAHEPKLLSCHHSFCLQCLRELGRERVAFNCPTCRKKTKLPSKGGVEALQTNFYIQKMLDIVVAPTASSSTTCDKHGNQPMLFYCQTCSVAICMNCTVLDHDRANGHVIVDVTSALKTHKELLQGKIKHMTQAAERKDKTLTLLKTEMNNLDTSHQVALNHLHETFDQLKVKLQKREAELESKLTAMYEEKRAQIRTQAQLVKTQLEQLNRTSIEFSNIVASNDVHGAIKAGNLGHVDDLCHVTKPRSQVYNYVQFNYEQGLQDYIVSLEKLGDITDDQHLPSDVTITVNDAISSIKSTIKVRVRSLTKQPLANYPLTAEICDPCGDLLATKTQSEGGGVYTIKYRPQMPGKHTLRLLFLGTPLSDEQWTVASNDPVLKLGGQEKESDGQGQLYKPTSVAVGKTGNVYVADMGNKRIQIFTANGEYISQIKLAGKVTTYDVTINPLTEELLCSKVAPDDVTGKMTSHGVLRYGPSGEKLKGFSNPEIGNGLFLTVTNKGRIVVSDPSTHTLHVYSKDGLPLKRLGQEGEGHAQFNFPSAICAGQGDHIIVTDTKNSRLQIITSDGQFVRQIGQFGSKKGQLKAPRGVAMDTSGNVLVADSQNRIQVFKYDGTFVSCIDSSGDKINEPYNMAVTDDGHVYVADFKNNCVKKYRYM